MESSSTLLSPLHDLRRYTCPGEPGDISRSIHLARLAASYAKCRNCPHHLDTGMSPRPQSAASPAQPSAALRVDELVQTAHGFRGVYLNQLDRPAAILWAAALGSLLWEDGPPIWIGSESSSAGLSVPMTRRTGPTVVIGYDERPASPDLVTGMALGLQRMSCQVIDIGLATEPCLAFAVHHLSADAGLYVTGSGCDPAWIGFDLRGRHGLPPEATLLDRWQSIRRQPVSRPSRSGGSLRPFPAVVPYEANLWKHFHALRPLQVVCGASSPQLLARMERLFARLPGRLHAICIPVRRRDWNHPQDADLMQVGQVVRDQAAHLGIVIDDDGMTAGFLDECGALVPAGQIAGLLMRHLLHDHGGGQVVLSRETWEELAPIATAQGGQPVLAAVHECAARMLATDSLLAVGGEHQLWFGGDAPTCDAVITLAHVMQALSLSDADFSQVVG